MDRFKTFAIATLVISAIAIMLWSLHRENDATYQCDILEGTIVADNGQGNCLLEDGTLRYVGN
jgi:hypothetical protein